MKKIIITVIVSALLMMLVACSNKEEAIVQKIEENKVEEIQENTISSESDTKQEEVKEDIKQEIKTIEKLKVETQESEEGKQKEKIEEVKQEKKVEEVKQEEKIELTGEFKSFTAKDLNGNTVNQDIITKAELTVINIWATFCGPCISEMPGLGELSKEYEGKGVQIIGIVSDEETDKAKQIIERTKADYIHLLPSEDLNKIYLNNVYYIPETLFVDKKGNILKSLVGSRDKGEWKKEIDALLSRGDV